MLIKARILEACQVDLDDIKIHIEYQLNTDILTKSNKASKPLIAVSDPLLKRKKHTHNEEEDTPRSPRVLHDSLSFL